ncbi:MAG: CD1247 N-terminal domain-containing protein [Porcipelethomonas sp.]
MNLSEKMSYLQGLLDGLDIDTSTKEGKLLVQMTEVMSEMVESVDDLQSQVDELTELCDILDADLGELEEDYYDLDDECDCDCCDDDYDFDEDDELYEVCCPVCGETVVLDEDMLEEGFIECPNCGESLEFDYFGDDTEEADDTEEE